MLRKNYAYLIAILIIASVFLNSVNAKLQSVRHASGSHHASHKSILYRSKPSDTGYPIGGLSGSGHSIRKTGNVSSLFNIPPSNFSHTDLSSGGESLNLVYFDSKHNGRSDSASRKTRSSRISRKIHHGSTNNHPQHKSSPSHHKPTKKHPTTKPHHTTTRRPHNYPSSPKPHSTTRRPHNYPSSPQPHLTTSPPYTPVQSHRHHNKTHGGSSVNKTNPTWPPRNITHGEISVNRTSQTHHPPTRPPQNMSHVGLPGNKTNPTSHPVTWPPRNITHGEISVNRTSQTHHPPTRPPQNMSHVGRFGNKINPTIKPPSNTHKHYWEVRYEPQRVHHYYHHYHYSPPPTVIYVNPSNGNTVSYPVYRGKYIPQYIYVYRSSKNKYRRLLSGLALYNLGEVSTSSSRRHYHETYVSKPDEICIFGVQYRTGYKDEMTIDCQAITYFIWEEERKPKIISIINNQALLSNGTIISTAVAGQFANYSADTSSLVMLPNGTLVSATVANILLENTQVLLPNRTKIDYVTGSKFYGDPVAVKSNMECYVIRITRSSKMRESVPCDLLQTYALKSMRKSAAYVLKSSLTVILIALSFLLL